MKGLTSIARGAAASTSYKRLPALIDVSIRPSLQTAIRSPLVCSPYPSKAPWIVRQSSTTATTNTIPSRTDVMAQSLPETITEEIRLTSGRRKKGRNTDLKELKDLSEGTALALLRVLGVLDTGNYSDIGRTLQYTQQLTQRRYPDMNSSQVNLQAILINLLRMSQRNGNRILPEELIRIHWSLVNDPSSIYEKLIRNVLSLEDIPEHTLPKIPLCQESLQTFKTLLKHAHKHNKAKLFNIIRENARRYFLGIDSHLLQSPKERIKRQTEMEQVDLMVQSLILSSSAKRAFHHNLSRGGGLVRKGRTRSTNSIFRSQNDIHVMSKILRTRYGALKPKKGQDLDNPDVKIEYRLSKHAANSAHPPLHHSRRTRKVNRLVQRAMSGAQMPKLRSAPNPITPAAEEVQAVKGSKHNASQKLLKTVEKTFPSFQTKKKENETTVSAMPLLHDEAKKMNVIDREVRAWRENVRLWHLRRANVTKNLTRVAAESSKETNVDEPQSQDRSSAPLLPTWLFSAALQAHVETGRPRMANHIVQLYLEMLYQNKDVKSEELVQLLPVSPSIVRAITDPLCPPHSEMILNALLRVQLMSGMSDSFECMLSVIEKWCSGGKGFADKVRNVCGMKSVKESNILQAHRNLQPHKDQGMACLHPNEASILLLLESLRSRHGRKSKGKAVVNEAFLRWGPQDIIPDSVAVDKETPRGHLSTFTPTTRTFRSLLQLAYTNKREQDYVSDVLHLFEGWLECVDIKALSSGSEASLSQVRSLMFHRDPYEAHQEQAKWKRVIERGLKKRLIADEQAERVLAKSMFDF